MRNFVIGQSRLRRRANAPKANNGKLINNIEEGSGTEIRAEGFEVEARQSIVGTKSRNSLFKIGLLDPRGKVCNPE